MCSNEINNEKKVENETFLIIEHPCDEEKNVNELTFDKSDKIDKKLDVLEQGISSLRELTEGLTFKLDENKTREGLIEKLHTENQAFKSNIYKKLIMPYVNEIIFLVDNYSQLRKNYANKDVSEIDTKKLLGQFCDIVEDLENVLYKNGIDFYETEAGNPIDFSKHKIIKSIPTDNSKIDKTVCVSLKKGFILDEKIIRQEQITCYKYEEKNTTEKE